jgi:signal transduction histidine kinase
MLGYSRETAGEQAPCSIAGIVENAVGLLSKQFLGGIGLQLDLDRELPSVVLARGRLEQILLNLVVNASEAMKGEGRLRISVRESSATRGGWVLPPAQASRYVELLVADSGPGIPPEVLPRIFEPFFTTKNTGTTRGTGLGLSMIYTLAQHEGFGLRVESELGKGTAFSIVIPVRVTPGGERSECDRL